MYYLELAEVYKRLENASQRLEKTYIISRLIKDKKGEELKYLIYLLEGRVFPKWDERKIGFSSRLIIKAINNATGIPNENVEKLWIEKGDLGIVAEILILKKKQTTLFTHKLTIEKVFHNIQELASLEGKGAVGRKVSLVSELLTSASPLEARYIVRTVLESLRVGVAEGVLRDAIAWSYFPKILGVFVVCDSCKELVPITKECVSCNKKLSYLDLEIYAKKNCLIVNSLKDVVDLKTKKICVYVKEESEARKIFNSFTDKVQDLFNLTNDFSQVVEALYTNKLDVKLDPGIPINPMLAVKVENVKEAFEELGKPLLAEEKLDGFRLQIHKYGKEIKLFTRRLENVTKQFKELFDVINESIDAKSYILDCEVIGYDPKTFRHLPFQSISQRIKRKILEKTIKEKKGKIVLTKKLVTADEKELEKFYKESLDKGNEGLMLKNLAKLYTPGRRVKGWLKLKPVLEPLDLVIVGATYGEGKRANYLSSFRLACLDSDKKKYLECGMVGSGIKEKELDVGINLIEISKILDPLIIKKQGRDVEVKPKIIVEVKYEEIQKSPTYNSGYALRFPRLIVFRNDKPLKDINTIKDIERIYNNQRAKKF